MNQLVRADRTPALFAAEGTRASYRFFVFFTAQIRNPNTRRAYARAAVEFLFRAAAIMARRRLRRLGAATMLVAGRISRLGS